MQISDLMLFAIIFQLIRTIDKLIEKSNPTADHPCEKRERRDIGDVGPNHNRLTCKSDCCRQ